MQDGMVMSQGKLPLAINTVLRNPRLLAVFSQDYRAFKLWRGGDVYSRPDISRMLLAPVPEGATLEQAFQCLLAQWPVWQSVRESSPSGSTGKEW